MLFTTGVYKKITVDCGGKLKLRLPRLAVYLLAWGLLTAVGEGAAAESLKAASRVTGLVKTRVPRLRILHGSNSA